MENFFVEKRGKLFFQQPLCKTPTFPQKACAKKVVAAVSENTVFHIFFYYYYYFYLYSLINIFILNLYSKRSEYYPKNL